MRPPLHTTWGFLAVSASLWAAGVGAIWWLMPVAPREGWQPPADEFVFGLLSDGHTIISMSRFGRAGGTAKAGGGVALRGPVRLQDINTGELRVNAFNEKEEYEEVMLSGHPDLLQLLERVGSAAQNEASYRLHLHDACTGKEIASIAFRCPLLGRPSWVLTADGSTVALLNFENEVSLVECYDVKTGRLLQQFHDCLGPMQFSPDGRRLAARNKVSVVVFDVGTGREIAMLDSPEAGVPMPIEFSLDGSLLLDSHNNVWDLTSGARRFGLPQDHRSCTFSRDGSELIGVGASASKSWLAYFDVFTGKEQVHRRTPLLTSNNPRMSIQKATPDGRWLVAVGGAETKPVPTWERWLGQFRAFRGWGAKRLSLTSILVETATGVEVARGTGSWRACTPDGRFVLGRDDAGLDQLWDVPPRKPLLQFFLVAGAWSVALAALATIIARHRASGSRRTARVWCQS